MKKLLIAVLSAVLILLMAFLVFASGSPEETGFIFDDPQMFEYVPKGFHDTATRYVTDDGETYYCLESEAGQSGLVITRWYDKNGNEMPSTFDPFIGQFDTDTAPKTENQTSGRKKAPAASLPAKYDARSEGLVTPVKNQVGGTCWAHSAVATIEANLIKNGYADAEDLNLSEYFLARMTKDGWFPGEEASANDGYVEPDKPNMYTTGSTYSKLWQRALRNFSGPVLSAKYDFAGIRKIQAVPLINETEEKIKYEDRYDHDFVVTGVKSIPLQVDAIKEAVLSYGACDLYFYMYRTDSYTDYYMNQETSAYYCPKTTNLGHAVSIVGWDDSYSRENFGKNAKPKADGAWLIKNSWGDYRGIGGFYWISYESRIYSAVVYETAPKEEFENVYLYDGLGPVSTVGAYGAANVFTAKESEILTKVGPGYALDSDDAYTFEVYVLPEDYSDPADGELVYTQTGFGSGSSYIELDEPLALDSGEVFSVVFRGYAKYGTEKASSATVMFQSNKRESYYLTSAGKWVDTGKTSRNNVCIRAVTRSADGESSVTFTCGGAFRDRVRTSGGKVDLPKAPSGYTQVITSNGKSFTGQNVTKDTVVTLHRYRTDGGGACIREYKCIYCNAEMKPSEGEHDILVYEVPATQTNFGRLMNSCRRCGFFSMATLSNDPPAETDREYDASSFGTNLNMIIDGGNMYAAPYFYRSDYTLSGTAENIFMHIRNKTEDYSGLVNGTIYINAPAKYLTKNDFSGFKHVKSISIPYTLETIDEGAFTDLPSLESFVIEDESEYFSVIDGVLYNKDATELIRYPAGKTDVYFTLPASVTSVAPYAFSGCKNLKYLDMSDSKIKSLASHCLSNMAALEVINLPDGLLTVGEYAIGLADGETSAFRALYLPQSVETVDEKFFAGYNGCAIYSYADMGAGSGYATVPASGHSHAYDTVVCEFSDESGCGRRVSVCACGRFTVTDGSAHVRGELKKEVAASCGGEGYKLCDCAVCGEDFRADRTSVTASHSWQWVYDSSAKCGKRCAEKHEECAVCGAKRNMRTREELPAYHQYSDVPDVVYKPSTCTEYGTGLFTCVICGDRKESPVSLAPHTDADGNGFCDGCGSEMPKPADLCKYCGKTHTGFFGKITAFFHNILYFFRNLFG